MLVIAGFLWIKQAVSPLRPALLPPPSDITQQIPTSTTSGIASSTLPLQLPAGFAISIYAKNLGDPRVIVADHGGGFLVSEPDRGAVVSVSDTDGDGYGETVTTVVDKLNKPHGIAMKCDNEQKCVLYIAETNAVATYDYFAATHKATNRTKIIDLPTGGRHITRTIMFMPAPNDNKLLISVGSSCDTCHETNEQRATILQANADGTDLHVYAKGLRNSVFMAIQPVTGDIWATEMGRDYLGDNIPPDEINVIKDGANYGWPNCYGNNIHDTVFDKNTYIRNPCKEPLEAAPSIDLPHHSAPLGSAFIPEEGWPQEYWYNMLVAYHGSWNRSVPTGYKVVRYKLDSQGKVLGTEDFITGWLDKGGATGRPVGILVQPGGTIFITDDKAGVIYRVVRTTGIQNVDGEATISRPAANAVVTSPVHITGKARGNWFFEASLPVRILDANGTVLASGPAMAQSDWMTTDFVPFDITLSFSAPTTNTGTIVVAKDNPSGLPEHDGSISIPIRFK